MKIFNEQKRASIKHVVIPTLTVVTMLFNTSTSSLASFSVNISGNGNSSASGVALDINSNTSVNQGNSTDITNAVDQTANTGGNTVSKNGGSVDITTGSIDTSSDVTNSTGVNTASAGQCGSCEDPDQVGIDIYGNGAESNTAIQAGFTKNSIVNQNNSGSISNSTVIDANTGNNTASKNTNGGVNITTGPISGNSATTNQYGSNYAAFGSSAWDVAINVSGNGAHSNVSLDLAFEQNNSIDQSNQYNITNEENITLNTGGNDCENNTDGECSITTGGISFGTEITNEGGTNTVGDPAEDDSPIGGIPDDDTNPTTDDSTTDDEDTNPSDNPLQELINDVVKKIIPTANAAEDETVLGATELPITGFGSMPTVSWFEILLGVYLLAFGAYMRHLISVAQKRFNYSRQNV